MKKVHRYSVSCTLAAVLSLSWAQAVCAQSSTPAEAVAQDASPSDGEIVVTAQRREESLQKVPVSVVAVSSEALERNAIRSTTELDALAPGLVTTSQAGNPQTYIRGVGSQSAAIGTESSVAYYVDGIYLANATSHVFGFNNIQRIEVLRGPQGTLFGRNALGGVVQVVTKLPSQDFTVEAGVDYGNYNTLTGSAYISGGLADNVAASLSIYGHNQADGFGVNLQNGQDVNYVKELAFRGDVLFSPAENATLRWVADYDRQSNDIGNNRNALPGSRLINGAGALANPFDQNANFQPFYRTRQWGISQDAKLELGDVTVRSITAWRQQINYAGVDQDATPLSINAFIRDEKNRTFQQEFLLSGSAGRLDFTAGAILFYQFSEYRPLQTFSSTPTGNARRDNQQETLAYAGYGQLNYHVTDELKVTGGFRYTWDRLDARGTTTATAGHPSGAGTNLAVFLTQKLRENKPTYRIGVDYQLGDTLLYASFNHGYRSGQFNVTNIAQAPTRAETLDAWEAGVKTRLFDVVRFNASIFHYKNQDIQLSANGFPPPNTFGTLNAANGRQRGAEFELIATPRLGTGKLNLGAALTLLDAKYTDFTNAPFNIPNPYSAVPAGFTCPAASSVSAGGNTQCVYDATGARMIRAPKSTINLSVNYSVPVASGELDMSASFYRNSGFFWEPSNRTKQPAYNLISGQIAYSFNEHVKVRVYGKNLTDERYFNSVQETALGDLAAPARPREYGVGLMFKW